MPLAALLEQNKQIYQLNMIRLKISVELGSTEEPLQLSGNSNPWVTLHPSRTWVLLPVKCKHLY